MTPQSRYLLIASMDVEPDRESLFNEVYDREHVPSLSGVPGIAAIARYERIELTMSIGGELKRMQSDAPKYHAIYDIDNAEVLKSAEWAEAVERGRWPAEVRPFTTNRRHLLLRRL